MGVYSSRFDGLRNADELFGLPTPCYVVDEDVIRKNCEILHGVAERTGCKILLAQKAFSDYDFYPVISEYLDGTEASGLFEARLGREEMENGEVHVFCAAYKEADIAEIVKYADHIVFNSVDQLKKFGEFAKKSGLSVGLRVNPECSTQEVHEIYDPCSKGSRLGVTLKNWEREMTKETLDLIDGLHFHTLCEQNSDDLEKTFYAFERNFGKYLDGMKWLNMGGGHHITRADYDIPRLEKVVKYARDRYGVQAYLEPGEAVALNAGYLVSTVLDVVENDINIAILDASAACHMPDVIEMPYLPPVYSATETGHRVRLAGPTCLAGDVVGDYFFAEKPKIGDKVIFGDMAIYSNCKNNTFNGMPLPDIYRLRGGKIDKLTNFGYADFKNRLGSRKISD